MIVIVVYAILWQSTFVLVLPDTDYSVTLNNVKGLEVCTTLESLTNLEILRYAQNDRVVSISKVTRQR